MRSPLARHARWHQGKRATRRPGGLGTGGQAVTPAALRENTTGNTMRRTDKHAIRQRLVQRRNGQIHHGAYLVVAPDLRRAVVKPLPLRDGVMELGDPPRVPYASRANAAPTTVGA